MMLCEQRCYLVFSDDESGALQAGSLHAVDIFALADAADVSPIHVRESRAVDPAPGDEAAYALLCDALGRSDAIALACVVVQCRPQLALLAPAGTALVLKILDRGDAASRLRHAGQDAGDMPLSEREMALARTIIDLMAASANGGKCGGEKRVREATHGVSSFALTARGDDDEHAGSCTSASTLSLLPLVCEGMQGADKLGILLPGGDPSSMVRRGSCSRPGAPLCRPRR